MREIETATMDSLPEPAGSSDDTVSISADLGSVKELGRYRSFLRRKAMGISPQFRTRLDASDLVQQTLLEAHERLDQFRGQSAPEMANWLARMLSNNIADAVRAQRRKKRDIAKERPLENAPSEIRGEAEWLAADQTSPSLCARKAEDVSRLSAAISELPPDQRDVVILHHLQGKALTEVAAQLGRSRSSVAGLLYRGLKALRESLA